MLKNKKKLILFINKNQLHNKKTCKAKMEEINNGLREFAQLNKELEVSFANILFINLQAMGGNASSVKKGGRDFNTHNSKNDQTTKFTENDYMKSSLFELTRREHKMPAFLEPILKKGAGVMPLKPHIFQEKFTTSHPEPKDTLA